MNRSCFASSLLVLACASLPFAQAQATSSPCTSAPVGDHGKSVNGKPLASPEANAETRLNGRMITIHYNAPSVRCRTIVGGVVPFGEVWRTGANPATSFTTEADLMIGDLRVPAGKYTLYTLPAAPGTPWMFIVNKETGQWGTVYHQAQDLGRMPMHAAKLTSPQEVMSLSFEKTMANTTQLHVKWELTDEWVDIKAAH
ncbi:MAG: DUF2911 domain-containing protein [Janthinobacterium lividum]